MTYTNTQVLTGSACTVHSIVKTFGRVFQIFKCRQNDAKIEGLKIFVVALIVSSKRCFSLKTKISIK